MQTDAFGLTASQRPVMSGQSAHAGGGVVVGAGVVVVVDVGAVGKVKKINRSRTATDRVSSSKVNGVIIPNVVVAYSLFEIVGYSSDVTARWFG